CSRRRPRCRFLGVHGLTARPPLLSGVVRRRTILPMPLSRPALTRFPNLKRNPSWSHLSTPIQIPCWFRGGKGQRRRQSHGTLAAPRPSGEFIAVLTVALRSSSTERRSLGLRG